MHVWPLKCETHTTLYSTKLVFVIAAVLVAEGQREEVFFFFFFPGFESDLRSNISGCQKKTTTLNLPETVKSKQK